MKIKRKNVDGVITIPRENWDSRIDYPYIVNNENSKGSTAIEFWKAVAEAKKAGGNPNDFGSQAWLELEFEKSGLPESYRERFFSNPYIQTYLDSYDKNSGFGKIFHEIGGTTKLDAVAMDAKQKALQYISDLISENAQNDYNSYEQQAERQAYAGLNPNLTGQDNLGDVGIPSHEYGAPSSAQGYNPLSEMMSPVSNIIGTAMNVASFFTELEGKKLDNENKKHQSTSSIEELAESMAIESITEDDFKKNEKGENELEPAYKKATAYAENIYPGRKNKHARQIFNNIFNLARRSMITQAKTWDAFKEMTGSQLESQSNIYDMENNVTQTMMAAQVAKWKIEEHYAKLEEELLNNEDYQELWQEEQYADLRSRLAGSYAEIAGAEASEAEDKFTKEMWDNLNGDDEAKKAAWESVKQDFIAKKKEAILRAKEAALHAADVAAVEGFLEANDEYGANVFRSNKGGYRWTSGKRYRWKRGEEYVYGHRNTTGKQLVDNFFEKGLEAGTQYLGGKYGKAVGKAGKILAH